MAQKQTVVTSVFSLQKDLNAVAIGTIATVLTPTTGNKFRLLGGMFSVSAACNVLFEDNTAGNFICRTPTLAADTPFRLSLGYGYLSNQANFVLKATSSASANITGTLFYSEESPSDARLIG